MALAIGSLTDESEIFTGHPAVPRFEFLTSLRNYFSSVGQRVALAMTAPYQRAHELLFVDPLKQAATVVFTQLEIGSAFEELQYGHHWPTCSDIAEWLHTRHGRPVNEEAVCHLLHFLGHVELLARHSAKTIIEGHPNEYRISYSLTPTGAFLSSKHLVPLVSYEHELHQALLGGNQLAAAITASVFDSKELASNPAAVRAFARSYEKTIAASSAFAGCKAVQTIAGADDVSAFDSSSDCLVFKAVVPFHQPATLRKAATAALSAGKKVFFVELVQQFHLHHMLNRFSAAADVFLLSAGHAAGLSSKTTQVLNAQPISSGTPFLIFPIQSATQVSA